MPIIYDSFETCEISVNLIGVLDYLICIPRPLAWGVFRSKTLQRYNKSLKYANYSPFFVFLQHIARLVYYCRRKQQSTIKLLRNKYSSLPQGRD